MSREERMDCGALVVVDCRTGVSFPARSVVLGRQLSPAISSASASKAISYPSPQAAESLSKRQFGSRVVNSRIAPQTLTFVNNAGRNLAYGKTVSCPFPALTSATRGTCTGATLTANASCTIKVVFRLAVAGPVHLDPINKTERLLTSPHPFEDQARVWHQVLLTETNHRDSVPQAGYSHS